MILRNDTYNKEDNHSGGIFQIPIIMKIYLLNNYENIGVPTDYFDSNA